jgi:uncharacterized membrane protein YtjA (UPF0391 family)
MLSSTKLASLGSPSVKMWMRGECATSVAPRGGIGTFLSHRGFHREGRCDHAAGTTNEAVIMLGWAITFLIVALIAGILGFGGVAIISVEIAKIIFVVAIILFLISAVFGFMRGRSSPMP